MADQIIDDLEDMFADTLVVQPGNRDEFGDFHPEGDSFDVPCHIEGETRLVRDLSGREVTSTVQVYCAGVFGLTVRDHSYNLPSGFAPREDREAISVGKERDENGAHHEVVNLP